jgi:HPt (histidine-containing phosphotransfer) domain-containing protein
VIATGPATVAEPVSPQTDAVDPERLAMLRGLDDGVGALLSELAVHFFDQATSTRIGLTAALDARDGGTVSRHAHKLRGAAANLGATGLEAVCADLERCGLDGRIEEATALLGRFDDECGRVRIALDAQIAEPAP